MQPPDVKVSTTSDHKPKRKTSAKKKIKTPSPDPVQTASNPYAVEPIERSPGPYRGKCLYQSRKCESERAVKRNGKPHNLCEEHRSKQNQHQRKFDAKKFSRKRRRGSDSDQEASSPAANKKHQPENQLEIPQMTNPMTNYPVVLTAPLTRLPSIQSPTGPILPTVVYPSGRMDAYPRAHVMSEFQGQRPYLQEPRTSQALPSYSHSELVAASILVPPQSTVPPPTPSSACYKQELGVPATGQQAVGTPRVLPSLRVTPTGLASSPFHAPSPARFAAVSPSRSLGNILPPLVPFGLRRSPTPISSPNSPNK